MFSVKGAKKQFSILTFQDPVQRLDNAIRHINCHSPVNKCSQNKLHYPLDSDLSSGQHYPSFEQLRPDLLCDYHDICFLKAIDDDCNQTGQMLSALLSWPQVIFLKTFYPSL